jgi:hypothetical protein
VKVGAGKHRIEHVYRPNSVYFGLGMTILGLFFAVLAGIYTRRDPLPVATASAPPIKSGGNACHGQTHDSGS